jgi:hypothetical protein
VWLLDSWRAVFLHRLGMNGQAFATVSRAQNLGLGGLFLHKQFVLLQSWLM